MNKSCISLKKIIIILSVFLFISSGTFLHNPYIRYAILLLLTFLILILSIKDKYFFLKKSSLNYIYALFTLSVTLSIFYSCDIIKTIILSITYFAALIFLNCKLKNKTYVKILKIVECVIIFFAITVIISAIFKNLMPKLHFLTDKTQLQILNDIANGQYAGFAGDRAEAALLMVIGIAIICSKFITKSESYLKLFLKIFLFYSALILTAKRMLFIISLVIPMIMLLFFVKRKQKIQIITIGFICLFSLGYLVLTVPEFNNLIVRFCDKEDYSTLNRRTELWKVSFDMFKKSPIIGTGFFTFNNYAKDANIKKWDGTYWSTQGHNCYFQIMGELGIIGLILFIGLFVAYYKLFFKLIKLKGKQTILELTYLYFNMFLVTIILLYSLTGNCAYYLNQIFMLSFAFSYTSSLYIEIKKRTDKHE